MINTKFVSNVCAICKTEKITFDEYYKLPNCFDFILVCPLHPAEIFFDISTEEMQKMSKKHSNKIINTTKNL